MNQTGEFELNRRKCLLILLLVIFLYSPSLSREFFADDYVHLGVLSGDLKHPTLRSWSLFDFGSYQDLQGEAGETFVLPWWMSSDWKARFFRPVASLSLWLDYRLFGASALAQHLTNLLLFCLILALLYPLYRGWGLSPEAAFWSLLVFACLDDNVTPVGWPANRNTLLAALFLIMTVLFMRRARQGKGLCLWGAFAAATAATLSKESGVIGFLFIAADLIWNSYEFQKQLPSNLIYRFCLMLSLLAPPLYLLALALNGFGTRSLFYATPWDAPDRFLGNLGILLATLWTNLVLPFSLDVLHFFPEHFYWLFWLGTIPGVVIFLIIFKRLFPKVHLMIPGLLWMFLALVPQAVAPISDRLLFLPFVGGACLLGIFIAEERNAAPRGNRKRFYLLVFFLCLPLSGAATFLQGLTLNSITRMNRQTVLKLSQLLKPGERDLILLQAPYSTTGFSVAWTYYGETADRSRHFLPMQMGRHEVRWERLSEDTFTLESPDELLAGPFERLFLTSRDGVSVGQRFQVGILNVEILEASGTGVRKFQVRLDRSLDSPDLVFLKAEGDDYARVVPPRVGRAITLPVPQVSNPLVP